MVRCIAHENEGSNIRLRIYDNTNSADIVSFLFGASSTRAAPGVAIITFELPTTARHGVAANCTSIIVSVEATSGENTVYLHQSELIENLFDNQSFEGGSGDPFIPYGWTNDNLDAGEGIEESGSVHSGSKAWKWATNIAWEGIYQTISMTPNRHYSFGCFAYKISGTTGVPITVSTHWELHYRASTGSTNALIAFTSGEVGPL